MNRHYANLKQNITNVYKEAFEKINFINFSVVQFCNERLRIRLQADLYLQTGKHYLLYVNLS